MRQLLSGLAALCLCVAPADAREPITELKVTPNQTAFANSAWDKPILIKSENDAANYFGKDAAATIAKQVNFEKQVVLLFAWKGSGGDKLEVEVLESFPEQARFSLRRGLTRDLRTHSRVFALPTDVRWSMKSKQ